MSIFYILLLAIIQGLTEFLPVSSSAHLALVPILTGLEDQGYQIDLAVHVGSLFAVMLFFWRDTLALIGGAFGVASFNFRAEKSQFFLKLCVATLPVIALGAWLEISGILEALRANPKILTTTIAMTMILFGIVLYISDTRFPEEREAVEWNFKDAIVMGIWQAIALIPGVSRSGATVTGSRFLKFNRQDGAKIAMLMSIPTILAGATLLILSGIQDKSLYGALGQSALIAAVASFFAALIALKLMMYFLKSSSYTPYVIYRILLGIVLLFLTWG